MVTELSTETYLEAAKIISDCKPSKLPYVLAALEKGGIDLSKEVIRTSIVKTADKKERLRLDRAERGHDGWKHTDSQAVLALRKAYDDGISFDKLSVVSGLGRCSLYQYLNGNRKPRKAFEERIIKGLDALNSQ